MTRIYSDRNLDYMVQVHILPYKVKTFSYVS